MTISVNDVWNCVANVTLTLLTSLFEAALGEVDRVYDVAVLKERLDGVTGHTGSGVFGLFGTRAQVGQD